MTPAIRLAVKDDAAAVAGIYGPFCESTAVSFEYVPPSTEEIANRIRTITAQFPWLVLDDNGVVAGYAYATRHRERAAYGWSADTAVYVSPIHRRCGVGRALYTALCQLLRLQGYFKAYAGITLPNSASTGLHVQVQCASLLDRGCAVHCEAVWSRSGPAEDCPDRDRLGDPEFQFSGDS